MNGSELLYSASQLVAKLNLLQKQCELLGQVLSEHELNSPVHIMNDQLAQISRKLDTLNRMID